MSQATLDAAVEKAAAQLTEQLSETKETKTEETQNVVELPSDPETPAEGEDSEKEDLSSEEAVEAKNLYRALRDPKSSSAIIAALAQQAGLFNKVEPPTTREIK